MTSTLAALLLGALLGRQEADTGLRPNKPGITDDEIRAVYSERQFRWYDGSKDSVVPVLPWIDPETGLFKRIGDWFRSLTNPFRGWFRWTRVWRVPGTAVRGDLIVKGLALLFLALLVVGLLELIRRYRPDLVDGSVKKLVKVGAPHSIEGLPAGIRLGDGDPWEEALKSRASGDYALAVIYLFAHQLLTLERLRQIRIVPGRTARQLVRTVSDRSLRNGVEPTLRLFELVYYGHRVPSAESFEQVWTQAERFERHRLEGATA